MKAVLVAVVLCACAPTGPREPTSKEELTAATNSDFFAAVGRQDVEAIRKFVREPLDYGGMWFPSPACQSEFPVARHLGVDKLADFAACLATLPLVPSTRKDSLYGVAVATYDPGIEVEIGFDYQHPKQGVAITWIGYVGRQNRNDGIPTVSPQILGSRIVTGDVMLATTPRANAALDAEMATLKVKPIYSWLKICIDAEGAVTSVRVRETMSPLLVSTFKPIIEAWKFQPFKLGDQAVPVCTHQLFLYPQGSFVEGAEQLPLPDYTDATDGLHVSSKVLERIVGNPQIHPDDVDKALISGSDVGTIETAVNYCIDEKGSVFKTLLVEPSGVPNYDEKVIAAVKTWQYKPFKIGGTPSRVCTGLVIRYSQR